MLFPVFASVAAVVSLLAAPADAVTTKNAKMAATLSSVAVKLPHGSYTLTNVGTGQSLYYNPNGNAIFPSSSATKVTISPHSSSDSPWVRLQFGNKNKCLASAWGGSYNNAAVMYMCAVGKTGVRTTLEPTKQWWLAVNIKKTNGNPKASTAVLMAAQQQSVKTRQKKINAAKHAFKDRLARRDESTTTDASDADADDLVSEDGDADTEEALYAELVAQEEQQWDDDDAALEKRDGELEKRGRRSRRSSKKSKKSKKAKKSSAQGGKVVGTFYFVPSDHLIDQATRALTASIYMSRGVKTTSIQPYKAGNKKQQWIVRKY